MTDVIAVFYRYRKFISGLTFSATVIAFVIVLVLPEKFVSVTTALPASSFAADKSTVFNTNIQELYSALGTADDLDNIIGTARLDTIYIATVHDLNLAAHYGFDATANGWERAMQKLKHNTSVVKSEWGELKIKAWDQDRIVAAQIANTLLKKLQSLHQNLRNQSNELVLQKLKEAYHTTLPEDTITQQIRPGVNGQHPLAKQQQDYEQLLTEYNVMVATNPPALLVVENARPALYPDNSEKVAAVILTFFAALLFAALLALFTARKK
jgi:hypothetical protein